jgi:hypothetical protein
METTEISAGFWWGCLRERHQIVRPRRRWKNNIKMNIQELGWNDMDWTDLAQVRGLLVGCCEHGNELSACVKCSGSLD